MQNQSLRWILETLSDFIWLFQVIFTLDLFTAFVALTHCAVIFNIMFGGEYTTFSPRDMELTGNIPPVSTPESRVVTTPKTQGSVTRRKLLPEFDRESPSPIQIPTEYNESTAVYDSNLPSPNVESKWSSFLRFWVTVILLCVTLLVAVYH